MPDWRARLNMATLVPLRDPLTIGSTRMQPLSPPRLASESDADALLAEAAAEQALLDAFYAFMYEPAVLAGASSPSKDSGNARATSPSRGAGSPRKHRIAGPTATSLSAASAPAAAATATLSAPASQLPREVMNALLPPKSVLSAQHRCAATLCVGMADQTGTCAGRGLTPRASGSAWSSSHTRRAVTPCSSKTRSTSSS